jgi:Phage terminase, small subunit
MGSRGPLPKSRSLRGEQRARVAAGTVMAGAELPVVADGDTAALHPLTIPDAPSDLGVAGLASWGDAWRLPWAYESDRAVIEQLARLEDERAELRADVDARGPVLTKPLTTSRGEVVGDEAYANPAIRELRRLDQSILPLRDRLGLSPLARARLGLEVVNLHRGNSALEDLKRRRTTSDSQRRR